MRQIYKIMLVLLILALIGSVYAAVQSSYTYTGCLATNTTKTTTKGTFYNIQTGTTPTLACKTGDYQISLYDKIQVDSLINTISNQITSLSNKVNNIENTYAGVYSATFVKEFSDAETNGDMYITFYLPVDSYIYVSSTGQIETQGPAGLRFQIDDGQDFNNSHNTRVIQGVCVSPTCSFYSISDGYKLSAGNHTIYLKGDSNIGIPEANLVVIATEKGSASCSACPLYK